jgi:hypothetical protein
MLCLHSKSHVGDSIGEREIPSGIHYKTKAKTIWLCTTRKKTYGIHYMVLKENRNSVPKEDHHTLTSFLAQKEIKK